MEGASVAGTAIVEPVDKVPTKRPRAGKSPAATFQAEAAPKRRPGRPSKKVPNGSDSSRRVLPGVQEPALVSSDPRSALATGLASYLTPIQVTWLMQEALAINKRVNVSLHCDNCGHMEKRWVEIADARAVVSALTDLITQGFGRPGEAKLETDTVIFKRLTRMEE